VSEANVVRTPRYVVARRLVKDDARVESLGGSLLVAGPSLWDPNFRRSVVLVGHHDDAGAVGVVLNRATEVDVVDAAPPLATLVGVGERVFVGGPVQPQSAVVVADFEHPELAEVIAFGSIGFLPDGVDAEGIGPLRRARVFAGYAGWGAGQLEREIEEGSWIVESARAEDVFTQEPGDLWSAVVRRKGPKYRLMATMPLDPTLN
jgi:putative transcriptional regulator